MLQLCCAPHSPGHMIVTSVILGLGRRMPVCILLNVCQCEYRSRRICGTSFRFWGFVGPSTLPEVKQNLTNGRVVGSTAPSPKVNYYTEVPAPTPWTHVRNVYDGELTEYTPSEDDGVSDWEWEEDWDEESNITILP